MTNEQNRILCRRLVRDFNESFNGAYNSLEKVISRAYPLFSGGFIPTEYPSSDFGKQVWEDLVKYSRLAS